MTDIQAVLAEMRARAHEVAEIHSSWRVALEEAPDYLVCQTCGDAESWPCVARLTAEGAAALLDVAEAAARLHHILEATTGCPSCEHYEGIGTKPCETLDALARLSGATPEEARG